MSLHRVALFLSLVIGMLLPTARAATPKKPAGLDDQPNRLTGEEITLEQQRSVERGLRWLADHQARDGSFGDRNPAITALGALAFMQAGNLPGRGQYGANVDRCLKSILDASQESGLIATDLTQSPMYGHGFATLFLAEVYGMSGDESVKERLQKAVRLIEKTQNPAGGWRYQPVPLDADISVTICQVMALRAARDAGIKVEKQVIDDAVKYVRSCQNADGGFSYMATMGGGGGSGYARSAAGVAALYYAGVFEGTDLKRGLEYLQRITGNINVKGVGEVEGHFFYGTYYCVQAMFLAGGDYWAKFYPAIRNRLIAQQSPQGNWTGDNSEAYATSMALIILQMPNRYLPVYNGKGPGS